MHLLPLLVDPFQMYVLKTTPAFINGGMKRNIDGLEDTVHGRTRSIDNSSNGNDSIAEERRFGVMTRPMMLGRGKVAGAQWTGAVTSIAVSMMEAKKVDAVVCIANGSDGGWSNPEPILARTVDDVLRGRGVKPGKRLCCLGVNDSRVLNITPARPSTGAKLTHIRRVEVRQKHQKATLLWSWVQRPSVSSNRR